MKICILYGGISSEREVSINTGKSVYNSIHKEHYVSMFDFDGDYDKLYDNVKDVDLVFIALHGGDGENGTIQKFFESENVKFTGPSAVAAEKAMDKNIAKLICQKNNIPTPNWALDFIIEDGAMSMSDKFISSGFVVKPIDEGSSFGITIFKQAPSESEFRKSIKKARKVSESIMLEEYIEGRELTVSILGNNSLPIVEIIPKGDYYDYESKYTKFQSEYIVPAKIDEEIEELLCAYSLKIHKLIGCVSYSRIDFRLSKDNKIYFLEINTLPGFTDTSLFPKSAKSAGISYGELINKIIKLSI